MIRNIRPLLYSLAMALAVGTATVQAAQLNLTWTAPAANTDGSPLLNLEGYIVYYGTESGDYQAGVDVGNTTQAAITGLQAGVTYYFAVQAYNGWNFPSDLSGEISGSTPLSTLPDADQDGMPDVWEIAQFGSVSSVNGGPDDDYDGDEFTNLEEYIAGTHAADASSGPFITVTVKNRNKVLTFEAVQAEAGSKRYYALERADSPDGPLWTAIKGYEQVLGANQIVSYVDRTRKRSYYRLNIWLE